MIRIAAVGDVHVGTDSAGQAGTLLAGIDQYADVLLIAGGLTRHGLADEARVLADDLSRLGLPVVAVLGSADWHHGQQDEIVDVLREAGVEVLEGTSARIAIGEHVLGVAGTKGFGGGFAGAAVADFGEPQMKWFTAHSRETAESLSVALAEIADCDVQVAMTHYAPIAETLLGEHMEIYPFLGSHLLGDVIDAHRPALAVHGRAHRGSEKGTSAAGVPVRNVAAPVLRRPYGVYQAHAAPAVPAAPRIVADHGSRTS